MCSGRNKAPNRPSMLPTILKLRRTQGRLFVVGTKRCRAAGLSSHPSSWAGMGVLPRGWGEPCMSQQEASGPHSPAHGVNLGVRTAGKEVSCSEGPCPWGPCAGSDSLRGGEDGQSDELGKPRDAPAGTHCSKGCGSTQPAGKGSPRRVRTEGRGDSSKIKT